MTLYKKDFMACIQNTFIKTLTRFFAIRFLFHILLNDKVRMTKKRANIVISAF